MLMLLQKTEKNCHILGLPKNAPLETFKFPSVCMILMLRITFLIFKCALDQRAHQKKYFYFNVLLENLFLEI